MDKKAVFGLIFVLIFPAVFLALSGDLAWLQGWLFSVWFIVLCYSAILYLYWKDPDLLAERYQKPGAGNQAGWDRYVVVGLIIGFSAWIIIMPLDARRFGWSPAFPVWVSAIGVLCLAASFFLFLRSYIDNPFLSPLVEFRRIGSNVLSRPESTDSSGIRCISEPH